MAYKRLALPFDGRRARELRERQGLTLKDLESRTEQAGDRISHTLLCRYEKGVYGPNARRLKVIATALNATIDDLLTPSSEVRKSA